MGNDMTRTGAANALESLIAGGDLSKMNAEDRIAYYARVCESLALNPLTRPFEYLVLNGKTLLYARKDCTEQLRKRDKVALAIVARECVEGVYVVTARATTPDGRSDESIGAVPIEGLKGEAKANAMMKAETKSKRRVTLSVCGLGFLDETEVETIPTAQVHATEPRQEQPALPAPAPKPKPAGDNTLPPDGAELFRRLGQYDAKLASEGRILAGELVRHVVQAGVQAGRDSDMTTWNDRRDILAAVDVAREFAETHEKRVHADPSAPAKAPPKPHGPINEEQVRILEEWCNQRDTPFEDVANAYRRPDGTPKEKLAELTVEEWVVAVDLLTNPPAPKPAGKRKAVGAK